MKSFASLAFILLLTPALAAPRNSLLIEDMTWTEVRNAIAAAKTTAIYYAASTEQNGPGVALGKHVFIAHYLSQKIARELGNALVYPTMPFAPTGDWGLTNPGTLDPAKKTGHMRSACYDRADDRSQQLLESHIQKGGQDLDSPGGSPVSVERIFSIPGAPQH